MKYIKTFESFSINEDKYTCDTTKAPASGWLVIENPSGMQVDDSTIEKIYDYFGLTLGSKTGGILDVSSSMEAVPAMMPGEWSGDEVGSIRLNMDNENISTKLEDRKGVLSDIGNILKSKTEPKSYAMGGGTNLSGVKPKPKATNPKEFRFTGIGNV